MLAPACSCRYCLATYASYNYSFSVGCVALFLLALQTLGRLTPGLRGFHFVLWPQRLDMAFACFDCGRCTQSVGEWKFRWSLVANRIELLTIDLEFSLKHFKHGIAAKGFHHNLLGINTRSHAPARLALIWLMGENWANSSVWFSNLLFACPWRVQSNGRCIWIQKILWNCNIS